MGGLIDYSMHPILPKAQAMRIGYPKYFDGFPCKNGHISARRINPDKPGSRGRCGECVREAASLSAIRKKSVDREGWLAYRAFGRRLNPEKTMFRNAFSRAKLKGYEFTITHADVVIPEACPCCGVKMKVQCGPSGRGATPSSPSLDRINPKLGYIPGNVAVICNDCNMTKGKAGIAELERVVKWLKGLQN